MREKSSETPPCGALTWPSSDEPTPKGTIGASCRAQSLHEVDHVVLGLGEDDGVRRLVLEPGQRVPVRLANSLRGGESVAETSGEIGIERGDRSLESRPSRLRTEREEGAIRAPLRIGGRREL